MDKLTFLVELAQHPDAFVQLAGRSVLRTFVCGKHASDNFEMLTKYGFVRFVDKGTHICHYCAMAETIASMSKRLADDIDGQVLDIMRYSHLIT